ncbi:MAG: head decoration protein [Shimia sp.]|nr:head decoration protein [Shimia sp.]
MSNPSIIDIDTSAVMLEGGVFNDELLTFAAAATIKAGTILARSTATGKLVPFVKGGTTAGNGVPKALVTYPVVAAAAGDVSIRAAMSGKVNAPKLVIAADGDASNVDAAVLDSLRAYGLAPVGVTELNFYDNK